MKFSKNRRHFLRDSAVGLGALSQLGRLRSAKADVAPRHHMINIALYGGWDSLWFHNGAPSTDFANIIDNVRPIVAGSPGSSQEFLSTSGNILEPIGSTYLDTPSGQWTVRYPDSYLVKHPSGVMMGPGMSIYTADDFSDILIWRGINASDGGHVNGNIINQCGALGATYPSFSAIIATQAVMNGNVRPLHYVQVAPSSSALYTQTGEYGSYVQAINIPSPTSWQNQTQPSADELPVDRRSYLSSAISALTQAAVQNPATITSTQAVYQSFLSSFMGADFITSSEFGASSSFANIQAAYQASITSMVSGHVFQNWFNLADDITKTGGSGVSFITDLSFRFALAEFLVVNNLSVSVDVMIDGARDTHDRSDQEAIYKLALHAAFVTLVRRLKAQESVPGSGVSMLGVTTIVVQTEFDREPLLSVQTSPFANEAGTGHWQNSTSYLLAGKGVKAGILGDYMRTTSGLYSASNFPQTYYMPMPVNWTSGQVDPNGTIATIHALSPTILSIFGATNLRVVNVFTNPMTAAMSGT